MKNIWKLLMIAMMAIAMVGCPQPDDTGDNNGGNSGSSYEKIYVAGFNNVWASDTAVGDCPVMKTTDGKIYTVDLTAASKNPTPYGIKFTTKMGWAKQYMRAEARTLTEEQIKYVDSDEEVEFVAATKAEAEAVVSGEGDDAIKVFDNNTKIYMNQTVNVGATVTVTFNLETMKAKITYAGSGNKVTDIFVDDPKAFNSGVGNYTLDLDEDASTGNKYVYKGKIDYTAEAATDAGWSLDVATGDLGFGICETAGQWSQKYTGATLTLGETAKMTYGAGDNNNISGLTAGESYFVTVVAIAAADSTLWSNCTAVYVMISDDEAATPEIPDGGDDNDSSEIAADSSEVAAESSEVAAESSEVAAESSEVAAESSEVAAESSEAAAESSEAAAESSEAAAESSEAAAESSEAAAESSEAADSSNA